MCLKVEAASARCRIASLQWDIYSSQNMETMIRKIKFKHQMHLPKHRVSQHLMAYHHKKCHFGLHMIAYKPCSKQPHISCSLVAYDWFSSGWLWSHIPSGKPLHGYGESPFWIGKSTVSMAMFKIAHCNKLPAGTVLAVLAIYFCVIVDFGHVNGIFNKDPPVTAGRTHHLAQLCRATDITRAASCRLKER